MSDRNEELGKLLNSSGFLFQLAVEHLVSSNPDQPWRVISREHPWKDRNTAAGGFIDLILAAGIGIVWMVCECKRTKGGEWIFLVERNTPSQVSTIRCSWIAGLAGCMGLAGWDDVTFHPASRESAFCVVRGNEKDSPLLERIAGTLLQSVDCLAEEDIEYMERKKLDYRGVYIPALITNAKLYVSEVDPGTISITDGTVMTPQFVEVPMIRFKKSLSLQQPPNAKAHDIIEAAKERERTVMVINSDALLEVLSTANMKKEFWEDPHPWDAAMNRAKQEAGRQ